FVNHHESPALVRVYSNQPRVRLEVDGVDRGAGTGLDHVFEWMVELDPAGTTVRAVADGTAGDEATVVRVDVADASYVCPQPSTFGGRTRRLESWYEKEGLTADPSIYSTWSSVGELIANPRTREVLIDVLGPEFGGEGESSALINENTPLTVDFIAGYA